jgi:integrase
MCAPARQPAARFFLRGSESMTGARSGNSVTMRTSPPIGLTVFRSVESNRSLRFSSRETLSWVIPRVLATRACVSLRALLFTDMAISFPSLAGQNGHRNVHRPFVSVRGRIVFRSHPICRPQQVRPPYAGTKTNPAYAVVFLTAATRLRVSEALGLKWSDVDFRSGIIALKPRETEASQKPVPMDGAPAAALREWSAQTWYRRPEDWVFATQRCTACNRTGRKRRSGTKCAVSYVRSRIF